MTGIGFVVFGLFILAWQDATKDQSTTFQVVSYLVLCAVLSGLTGHRLW